MWKDKSVNECSWVSEDQITDEQLIQEFLREGRKTKTRNTSNSNRTLNINQRPSINIRENRFQQVTSPQATISNNISSRRKQLLEDSLNESRRSST